MRKLEKKLEKAPSGAYFIGTILSIFVGGRICKENNNIYFCTNCSELSGDDCRNKYGYKYSWRLDNYVEDDIKIVKGKNDLPKEKEIEIASYKATVSSKQVIVGCQIVTFEQVRNLLNVLKAINKFPKVEVGDYNVDHGNIILGKGEVELDGNILYINEVENVYKEMLKLQRKKK